MVEFEKTPQNIFSTFFWNCGISLQKPTLNNLNLVFEPTVLKPPKFDVLAHFYKFELYQN